MDQNAKSIIGDWGRPGIMKLSGPLGARDLELG
jgi:hypothetical protein